SSTSRPRWCGEISWRTSGYCTVALRSNMRTSVVTMPLARPIPGMRIIGAARSLQDHDRDRRHEDVEERRGEQPLPGEGHELVDAHARERGANPDEHEDQCEGLAQEPEDAGHGLGGDI